jgi:hypothetical protein
MFELPQVVPESGQEREALIKRANHQFCSEFISSALQAFILVIEVNDTKAEPRLVEVSELSPIALHMLLRESSVLLWIYEFHYRSLHPRYCSPRYQSRASTGRGQQAITNCIICPCAPDCLHP